jgi:hypothetical protein
MWLNGDKYEGLFECGKMHGVGTFTTGDGVAIEYKYDHGVLESKNGVVGADPAPAATLSSLSDSRVLVPLMAITAGIMFYFFLTQSAGMSLYTFPGQHKHVM